MNTLQTGLDDLALHEIAVANLQAAEQSATARALRDEWVALTTERGSDSGIMFDARRARDGRPVFIARAQSGYHESFQGYEHAMSLLVSAHRTRLEDRAETHERARESIGCDLQRARVFCAEIAKRVRESNPGISEAEQDVIILQEIDAYSNPPPADRE